MVSTKECLLNGSYRARPFSGEVNFSDYLFTILIEQGSISELESERIVTRSIQRYWNDFKRRIDEDIKNHRTPPFIVASEELKTIKFISTEKADQVSHNRPRFLKYIDSLSDRKYEALGCVVSKLMGACEVYLTPKGNEGGIDFLAKIDISLKHHVFGCPMRGVRIVGQTKKYSSKETITKFNSFITTLNNVRTLHSSVKKHLPSWFLRGEGPIVGWYISSSGFQAGVISTARENGVVLSDSIDLAEIMSIELNDKDYPYPSNRLLKINTEIVRLMRAVKGAESSII